MDTVSANCNRTFGPADALLSDAIEHLRTHFGCELEAILSGRYACWLGSGISISRYPGLKSLVWTLLERLYEKCDFNRAECPWNRCLDDILGLVQADVIDIRPALDAGDSSLADSTLNQLVDRYSDVLDHNVVDGGRNYSMTWDVLHLDDVYGDRSILPDADHALLAILLAEGAFQELITTNWDSLVERALDAACASGNHSLAVVVEASDISGSRDARSRIIKVHGCACRCLNDAAKRGQMVATRREIQAWQLDSDRKAIRELVRTVIRERPAVFVGLSAQDWNLQSEILAACKDTEGPLPEISRVLFAEPSIRQPQRTVIRNMFGEEAYLADQTAIEKNATLGLYAKPLLGALYIIAVRKKLDLVIDAGADELSPKWLPFVRDVIEQLEGWITTHFDSLRNPQDDGALWKRFVEVLPPFIARCSRLFLKYDVPASMEEYHPFFPGSYEDLSDRLSAEENPSMTWFLFVIASIYAGVRDGLWSITSSVGKEGVYGQFELFLHGRALSVFVVRDQDSGKAKLFKGDFLSSDGTRYAALLYTSGRRPESKRHAPFHSLPYTFPEDGPVEIWIQELAEVHPDSGSLLEGLKHELLCI